MVFAIGPAGTGKTYLAVAVALHYLLSGSIKKIVLTRPVLEAGENLGFLPGTLEEKINPYIRPLQDAIGDMLTPDEIKLYTQTLVIEVAPLAYMRGRTLSNAFVILDEAQNTTPTQMKLFLTRMGEGSKMIVTGDVSQTDLPATWSPFLKLASELFANVEGIAFHYFDKIRRGTPRSVKRIIEISEKKERNYGKEKRKGHRKYLEMCTGVTGSDIASALSVAYLMASPVSSCPYMHRTSRLLHRDTAVQSVASDYTFHTTTAESSRASFVYPNTSRRLQLRPGARLRIGEVVSNFMRLCAGRTSNSRGIERYGSRCLVRR
jgi:hypothetical protein